MVTLAQALPQPVPGQEVYWLLGLMGAAISALFWQLLKAKDDTITRERALNDKLTATIPELVSGFREVKEVILSDRTSKRT